MSPVLRGAAAIVAAVAAGRLVGAVLEERALAAELFAALAVDFVASRFGATYHGEGDAPVPRRETSHAAALGAGAVVVAIAVGFGMRSLRIVPGSPSVVPLFFGVLHAVAVAVRVEIAFRYIPFRLLSAHVPKGPLLAFTVLLGGAAVSPYGAPAVALALAQGLLSAVLLARTSSIFPALASHAATVFTASTLATSIVDVRWTEGSLAVLDQARGPAPWLLAATLALAAAAAVPLLPRIPKAP
jgi:hypothetical protein